MKESQGQTIKWNFDTAAWQGITVERVQLWEMLFSNTDVIRVLKVDIPRWLESQKQDNGKVNRKARKSNWHRFIVNWLNREEQKAIGIL